MLTFEDGQQLLQSLPAHSSLQSEALQAQFSPHLQPPPRRRQAQPSGSPSLASEPVHREQRRRKSRSKHAYTSPFYDCLDSFGRNLPRRKFPRPIDGKVNGYIKFSWPLKEGRQSSTTADVASIDYQGSSPSSVVATQISNRNSELSLQRRCSASPASTSTLSAGSASPYSTSSTLTPSQIGGFLQSPTGSFRSCCPSDDTEAPQLLPSQFGLTGVMDNMGRKLFSFCKFCLRQFALQYILNLVL